MSTAWTAKPGDECRTVCTFKPGQDTGVDAERMKRNAHEALQRVCAEQGLTATDIRELWRGTYTDALELLCEPSTHCVSADAIEGAKAAQSAADSLDVGRRRPDLVAFSVWKATAQ